MTTDGEGREMEFTEKPTCPYCGKRLTVTVEVFPGELPNFWRSCCEDRDAES